MHRDPLGIGSASFHSPPVHGRKVKGGTGARKVKPASIFRLAGPQGGAELVVLHVCVSTMEEGETE